MKKVKVLIPAYNAEKTIRKTLDSLLAQTYQNFELWIIDNCSTDRTKEIVFSYKDPRINYMCNESNLGNYGNFNRCISYADYDYTAIYHADDVYLPSIIEEQVRVLDEHQDVGVVFAEADKIDEYDRLIGSMATPIGAKLFTFGKVLIADFKLMSKLIFRYSCFLMCPTAMVRTEVYRDQSIKTRPELFETAADVDLWFQIAERWKVAIVLKKLIHYRISTSQHTFQIYNKLTSRRDLIWVINYYRKKYKILFNDSTIDIRREKLIDMVMRLKSLDPKNHKAIRMRSLILRNLFDLRLYTRLRWYKYVLLFVGRSICPGKF